MAVNLDTWSIRYDEILEAARASESVTLDVLREQLVTAAIRSYKRSNSHTSRICAIDLGGFEYLFDDASPDTRTAKNELVCQRLVAVHGLSRSVDGKPRPASRLRGFPRGAASDPGVVDSVRHDRGHFVAHASGGEQDINLFAQLTHVNRGWSPQGRVYRQMERHLAANPGTYFFLRPIYTGPTDHPYLIEFGILVGGAEFRVERFENCRSIEEMHAIEEALADRMRRREPESFPR